MTFFISTLDFRSVRGKEKKIRFIELFADGQKVVAAEATEAIEAMGAWGYEGERSVAAINQKNELKT